MQLLLKKAVAGVLATLLVSGPAAAEIARLPERLNLGVSAPSAQTSVQRPAPAAAALPLPTLAPLAPLSSQAPATGILPQAELAVSPAASSESKTAAAEQIRAEAGQAFDGSGGGPSAKPPNGALTTAVLRGIGLTTALSAATVPWHAMHPAWIALGAIPVVAGLAFGLGHINFRDPTTDRPLVPAPRMSLKSSAMDVWRFLRKKDQGPRRAIRGWRYIMALKGPWPTLRLAGPGVWFVTTGLRIAANATLVTWFPNPTLRLAGRVIQVFGLGLAAFSAYFYRDPQRQAAFGPDDVASPADGRILSVRSEKPGEITVRIFLSALNVHVQRAPFDGRVTDMTYTRGKFVVASTPEAAEKNERNATRIEGKDGRWAVVDQLTGMVARRIATWVEPGQGVTQGQRTGMIFFGSQVAVHLPASAKVLVKPGDKVTGGRSILARF